jgi:hypothetical protein
MWMFLVGGVFIGAGVLTPFKRARVGAIVGALVQFALIWSACCLGWPNF